MLFVFIFLSEPREIVWSDLYASVSPADCIYIWLLPDLPCKSGSPDDMT